MLDWLKKKESIHPNVTAMELIVSVVGLCCLLLAGGILAIALLGVV